MLNRVRPQGAMEKTPSTAPPEIGSVASPNWTRILARYRDPNPLRSVFEVAITALPFTILWVAAWATLSHGYWLSLLLAVPAAGFLVRLFMIQHDCGHGALFRHRLVNDWIGRAIGVLTLTPYDLWRRSHATHHATIGNLDRRGIGDINTLTVRQYQSRSYWGRLSYRLYRHPIVMFVLGPAHLFVLQHRFPFGYMRKGWGPWISTMGTNGVILAVIAILISLIGLKAFLLVHLPIVLLAASVGVWLFYVQHQFEDTSWERAPSWNLQEAALRGSSHYDLPCFLRWFTANIGMHHVHHLCSQIPYYRLPRAFRDHPELKHVSRLTLTESFRCVWLTLWDENRKRLVSFREAGLHRHQCTN
jgi:omega-6 fatty acid desaturase (delta-12 desaturase)